MTGKDLSRCKGKKKKLDGSVLRLPVISSQVISAEKIMCPFIRKEDKI
jgi:hypothetical protein